MRPVVAALVQMRATPQLPESVEAATALTREALCGGAQLVVLPENHCGIGAPAAKLGWAVDPEAPERAPALAPLCQLSAEHDAWLIAGGVPERAPGGRVYNTAMVIHRGRVIARYRKVHLFDAHLPDGTVLTESEHTTPGDRPVLVHTPLGAIGLTICYDLRFAEVYLALAAAGAEIIVVPSAFTVPTGAAHWEPLLRTRAIETQTYVLAAAQQGVHGPGRASYGHSMIVGPWGTVVAQAQPGPAVVLCTLRPEVLTWARERLPVAHHRVALGPVRVVAHPGGEG